MAEQSRECGNATVAPIGGDELRIVLLTHDEGDAR
jgi:hypothetical protein